MKIIKLMLIPLIMAWLSGCDKWTDTENTPVQRANVYTDQYYKNLREYKNRPHQIFYGWYAAYAQKEGVDGPYKQSPSFGEHFMGLPDSLDFVSAWMGMPTKKNNPIAYDEMRRMRKLKGTKLMITSITRIQSQLDSLGNPIYAKGKDVSNNWIYNDESITEYAMSKVKEVFVQDESGDYYVDGFDIDYEPEGDWLSGANFTKFVQVMGKYVGPQAETELGRSKYLVIDFYSAAPAKETEPYVNFFVRQAYTQGFSQHSDANLQSSYNTLASWLPANKYVVTENFGVWWTTGGSPYLRANGTLMTHSDGSQVYSLEGMARWVPTQGPKLGFGAFYFDRDYQHYPAYGYVRSAIQVANPAQK